MDGLVKNLKEILDTMNVPAQRKVLTEHNLRWLGRNIAIQNGGHPELGVARHFIQILLTVGGDYEKQETDSTGPH